MKNDVYVGRSVRPQGAMTKGPLPRLARGLFALLLLAGSVGTAAAEDVGHVAAMEGTAEIGRGGGWSAATLGVAVQMGDELRTGNPGRLRVVFRDDSVISLGDGTRLLIDEQVFNPDEGSFRTLMKLFSGKVRAIASEYYQDAKSSYSIETPSAVVGVRGTDFVVLYDDDSDVTDVVGFTGRVSVHSVVDRFTRGVFVTAGEMSSIAFGQFPTAPHTLTDDALRRYMDDFEFFEARRFERLDFDHGLLKAAEVPEPDRAVRSQESTSDAGRDDVRDNRDVGSILDQPVTEEQSVPPPARDGGLRVRF